MLAIVWGFYGAFRGSDLVECVVATSVIARSEATKQSQARAEVVNGK